MTPPTPLEFEVPETLKRTKIDIDPAVNTFYPKLLFGRSKAIRWGNSSENSMLQQTYSNATVTLLFFSFTIAELCLLSLCCHQDCNLIQYTIQGHTFASFKGYGNLALLERTYLLQYLPKGVHKILMTPGTYQFVYLLPGPYLTLLTEKHSNIKLLFSQLKDTDKKKEWVVRLPVDTKIARVLQQIKALTSEDEKMDFALTAQVLQLLFQTDEQLRLNISEVQPSHPELPAYINHFIAGRLQLPVPELIHKIKERFHIEVPTLRNNWNAGTDQEPAHLSSPRTALNAIRLKLAIFLLVNDRLSVSRVAEHLSYANLYSFSDHFKAHFGFSPIKALGKVHQ